MIKRGKFKNWALAIVATVSIGGGMLTIATPQVAMAADQCTESFVGFPAWYRGLTDPNCDIKSPKNSKELTNFIWHVVLNVLEIFLIILGYLTGFYFLYGGFLFIASQGKPETAAKARMTMVYAVFGLVAALVSVALVNFVVDKVLG